MAEVLTSLPAVAARLVGDPHPLRRQILPPSRSDRGGAPGGILPSAVQDLPTLRGFLTWYRTELLVPVEMPAILGGYRHASRHEVRELLELDRQLASEQRLRSFAAASRAVGRSQLWRLLPMRDQRLVRRYWHRIEAGEAHGWHVLVYGVVLSVFSLPPRQGLLNYGRQTLTGFVNSAAHSLRLPEDGCQALLDGECEMLRAGTERVLGPGRTPLRLCP